MDSTDQKGKLAEDLLVGAEAIADELGMTVAQVYRLVRAKHIPVGHIGKNLIASRRQLRKTIGSLTS